MGFRRRARELAMQALYYVDIRGRSPDDRVSLFRKLYPPPEKANIFFMELVEGVLRNRIALDTVIERFSSHWKISRMSCVDRNILRIAVFEVLVRSDIPVKVSINEAIDIGKKYGTDESGAFINGILDSIHQAWKQSDIVFEPVADPIADSGPATDESEDSNRLSNEMVAENHRQETSIEPVKTRRESVRLGPGLRKRMATQDKEP